MEGAEQGVPPLTFPSPAAFIPAIKTLFAKIRDRPGGERGRSIQRGDIRGSPIIFWVIRAGTPVSLVVLAPLMMPDNPSFVLRGIEDVVYEDRPIPDSALITRGVCKLPI
jgi:hypothetical protein